MVDTGAEVCVLPPSGSASSRIPTRYSLKAVNPSAIATYGTRSLTLDLGLCHTFQWVFLLAHVQHPILGAKFLHQFGLSVDIRQTSLVNNKTQLQILGLCTRTIVLAFPSIGSQNPIAAVFNDFPNVLIMCSLEEEYFLFCVHSSKHVLNWRSMVKWKLLGNKTILVEQWYS